MAIELDESSYALGSAQATYPLANARSESLSRSLVGASPWAAQARGAVAVHAAHASPVLIEGEPGVGKEFVARLIHMCSERRQGPFLAVSAGCASERTLGRMLFGVRDSGRPLIDVAEGGTLYLSGL